MKHLSTDRKRNDSPSSGERTGKSPNLYHLIAGRRCDKGVVGPEIEKRPLLASVTNREFSQMPLERAAKEGESPVDESGSDLGGSRVGRDTWNPV